MVCKELYSHQYYLSREEQQSYENKEEDKECSLKRACLEDGVSTRSADDYEKYKDVIPSAKSIRNFKHLQATQEEVKAAVALYRKTVNENITFHFDTTSRNCIDGEWPALILNFAKGERYNLRPVFFAYEDRENIAELITETYHRLCVAASTKLAEAVTAKQLWEKTNNIMTDSVTKNLSVENLVAAKLESDHIPYHLLCNAHVVEKFDATNLEVLSGIEEKLKLRERLESINPALRPFFRGKKAIVLAGMNALLKLIAHDKSGNTISLAEEFDILLELEGLVKHMTLYHERRFTKLGYCAASILSALPQLQQRLAETWKTNLLIEACRLYVNCELFVTELHLLAVFTKKVTLPFVNCVEKSSQKELLQIFPRLYEDLLLHNMDTLINFAVEYHHVTVPEIMDEAEKQVMKQMCEKAALGLEIQRGREYGFETVDQPTRGTTELHNIPECDLEGRYLEGRRYTIFHVNANLQHSVIVQLLQNFETINLQLKEFVMTWYYFSLVSLLLHMLRK